MLMLNKHQEVVLRPSPKETRKRHQHEASSSEDSDDLNDKVISSHKSPRVNSQNCVQLTTTPTHGEDDIVSIPRRK